MTARTKTKTAQAGLELVDVEQKTTQPPALQQTGALAANSPAAVMLQAAAQGFTLDQIEKMMDLQERYERREAEKAFAEAFAAFRGENIIIPKGKHVDRGKAGSFNQAEFDDVCRRLSPALSRHGFSFRHAQRFGTQRQMRDGIETDVEWVWVTCYLTHKAGHEIAEPLEGPPGDLNANTPVQNMQATASYLKRVSLLAITGTATGGEDDEEKLRKLKEGEAKSDEMGDLRSAGRAAATEGLQSLTAWWGSLTNKNRADLSKDFADMRKTAIQADREAAHV